MKMPKKKNKTTKPPYDFVLDLTISIHFTAIGVRIPIPNEILACANIVVLLDFFICFLSSVQLYQNSASKQIYFMLSPQLQHVEEIHVNDWLFENQICVPLYDFWPVFKTLSAFWCLCYLELSATLVTVAHKMDGCNCYYVYCVQFQRATNINVVWFIASWKNEPLNAAWLWLFFITWNTVEELVCLMRIIDSVQSVQNIIITVSRLKRVLFIMCKNIQGTLRNFVPTYYTDCIKNA